jgi:DNA-binding HxlR family transcriptional regulator
LLLEVDKIFGHEFTTGSSALSQRQWRFWLCDGRRWSCANFSRAASGNDLHRGVPLMSRSMLRLRLKQLEEASIVTRRSGIHGTEYHLTDQGRELPPIIHRLGERGQRWYRTNFDPDELDVGLLV